jgi:hypothetical protein
VTDHLWRVQQHRTRYLAFFAKLFFTWKKSGELEKVVGMCYILEMYCLQISKKF